MSSFGEFAPKLPGYNNAYQGVTALVINGTSNKISTSLSGATYTISIPATLDLSANTSTALASAAGLTPAAAGQMGVDTTAAMMVFYDGVAAQKLNPIESKALLISNSSGIATASGQTLFKFKSAATITQVSAVVTGTTPNISIQLGYGTNITSLTNIFSSAQAITNTTTGQDLTSFSASTPGAGAWLSLTTSALSGTVTTLCITVYFKY